MRKVVHIAHSEDSAKKIKDMLTANGFLVQLKGEGGKNKKAYEICVPFSEAEDACDVLREHQFHG